MQGDAAVRTTVVRRGETKFVAYAALLTCTRAKPTAKAYPHTIAFLCSNDSTSSMLENPSGARALLKLPRRRETEAWVVDKRRFVRPVGKET